MANIILNLRRQIASTSVLFAVFITVCCNQSKKIGIYDIPIPATVIKGNKYPELGTRVHNAVNLSTDLIEDRIGEFDSELLTFEETPNLEGIARFYDAQLKEKDFVRKSEKPADSAGTQILFYEHSGFSDKKKIAVVLIEATDYTSEKKYYYLLLGISRN